MVLNLGFCICDALPKLWHACLFVGLGPVGVFPTHFFIISYLLGGFHSFLL
jgi:hypothetical protein